MSRPESYEMLNIPFHWISDELIPILDSQLLGLGYVRSEYKEHTGTVWKYAHPDKKHDAYLLSPELVLSWKSHLMRTLWIVAYRFKINPVEWFLLYRWDYISDTLSRLDPHDGK